MLRRFLQGFMGAKRSPPFRVHDVQPPKLTLFSSPFNGRSFVVLVRTASMNLCKSNTTLNTSPLKNDRAQAGGCLPVGLMADLCCGTTGGYLVMGLCCGTTGGYLKIEE